MSGALGSIVGAVVGVAETLFGDSSPIVLGNFAFTDFAVPERLTWGGAQRLNVHQLPGGARVIDAMGRDDMAIRWSGIFLTPDHDILAQQLDELRVSGQPVPLSWGNHLWSVFVSEFQATPSSLVRTDYTITCTVVADLSAAPPDVSPTLLGQVQSDVAAAAAFAIPDAEGAAAAAQASAVAALQGIAVLAGGSASVATLLAAVAGAQGTIGGVGLAADAAIGAASTATLPLGSANPVTAAANLSSLVTQTQVTAGAQAAGGYLGRAADNLEGATP